MRSGAETMKKFWKNDAEMVKILDKYSVNPVITNLLKMSQYDFDGELGPNLLGHIFEKSMSALEKIGVGGDLSRKILVHIIHWKTLLRTSVAIQLFRI